MCPRRAREPFHRSAGNAGMLAMTRQWLPDTGGKFTQKQETTEGQGDTSVIRGQVTETAHAFRSTGTRSGWGPRVGVLAAT